MQDDDEWIDVSESNEEEISENESTADSADENESAADETAESCVSENEDDKTLTLSHSENNSAQNTCEADSEERKTDQVSQKKTVLTKQLKKTQKLERKAQYKSERDEELTAERKTKASVISTERLLTDKDFKKIDVALAKQDVTYVKRSVKRPRDQIETNQGGELVKLSDIENIYKKRKHDKATRQKSVKVCINYCISI